MRSQQLVGENNRQKLQEKIAELEYQLAEAKTHEFRLEKEAKDKSEIDKSIAELVAERDKLKEELTIVRNKLDGMYSENAKLSMQKLAAVNEVHARLQKEREEHAATKKQLLAQQQEVERLKVDNERLREEKKLTESSNLINLLEIKNLINTDLARSMKEIEAALG